MGGNEEINVDVRNVAATNRDLAGLVREQKFREDLYYRLNVIPLTIPPLRQRREDVEVLARHMLERHKASIDQAALAALVRYQWPGNVRELENVLERAVAIAGDNIIRSGDLLLDGSALAPELPGSGSLKHQVAQLERTLLVNALSRCGSSRRAGKLLGLSHTSILNKIRKHGLESYLASRKE